MWSRHRAELLEHLDLDAIPGLMNIVPLSIGPNLVLSWLELFVPDVLKKTPDVFPVVATLLVEKIEYVLNYFYTANLQLISPIRKYANVRTENWPREALDFCTSTVKILEPDELDELTGWLTEWRNPLSPFKQLKPLQKSLSDLCMLKEKLHVQLSLDEYSQVNLKKAVIGRGSNKAFVLLLVKKRRWAIQPVQESQTSADKVPHQQLLSPRPS